MNTDHPAPPAPLTDEHDDLFADQPIEEKDIARAEKAWENVEALKGRASIEYAQWMVLRLCRGWREQQARIAALEEQLRWRLPDAVTGEWKELPPINWDDSSYSIWVDVTVNSCWLGKRVVPAAWREEQQSWTGTNWEAIKDDILAWRYRPAPYAPGETK